ncbi:MAG: hypothetical protein E7529_05700 [Ruminococcaceae bacterium]|nr:hypothetical protein [Oscillospiraceae bacterium]
MAINIYGTCSGSSGSKYDIWLNVKQNSQSIEDNKSNVTVKLLLKRNDGYSASAYNLNEGSNSVVLKVGGKDRVNKNLTVDTRNNVTVTLATWTGDVAHTDDGSLSLAVSGSFSMGGTSLSGGSVSGSFNCTDIPRASALTLSKSSLNPLDSVGATLSVASDSFSHKIKWSLGDSSVTHSLSAGVTKDAFTVPLSWSEEITNAKSETISVTLATYKGTKKIGSKAYSLKLIIPATEEFLPDFNLITERIDNAVPLEIGEYVKGKSQIRLNIENLNLKHGAKASGYIAKVGSSSKTTLPAAFDLTKSGEISVSVTVKDSRGFSVTKTETINVLNYSAPTVSVNSLYRCDENGNKTTSGTNLLCALKINCSSLNDKNIPIITYKYKKAEDGIYSGEIPINESVSVLGNGEFLNNSSYILAFKITDSVTTDTDFIEVLVPSADIPFNIRKGGKGASFGCYSEKENELTVAWDLNVKGDLVYENVGIETSLLVTDKRGIVRYLPCLELVVVRLRFTANQSVSAGSSHIIATFEKTPTLFTPVTVSINTGSEKIGQGGIKSETGQLVINSDKTIEAGDYIYVSGVYFAYRN